MCGQCWHWVPLRRHDRKPWQRADLSLFSFSSLLISFVASWINSNSEWVAVRWFGGVVFSREKDNRLRFPMRLTVSIEHVCLSMNFTKLKCQNNEHRAKIWCQPYELGWLLILQRSRPIAVWKLQAILIIIKRIIRMNCNCFQITMRVRVKQCLQILIQKWWGNDDWMAWMFSLRAS